MYEPLGLYPTKDLLITRLHKGLTRDHTKRPVNSGGAFNMTKVMDLFHHWGTQLTREQLRAKLLALLSLLGAFRILAMALPFFDQVDQASSEDRLVVPVVGFKNDHFGEGNTVTLFPSSDSLCCPVKAFHDWKERTACMRAGHRSCRLLFSLDQPCWKLKPNECAEILRGVVEEAGIDTSVFTPKSFRKSGIMSGLDAGVQPDAIFKLGGWKCADTFWHHYMSCGIPTAYSNLIFRVGDDDHSGRGTS